MQTPCWSHWRQGLDGLSVRVGVSAGITKSTPPGPNSPSTRGDNCDKRPDVDGSRKQRKRKANEPTRRSAQIRAYDNLSKYSAKRRKEEDDDEEEESTPKRRKTTAPPPRGVNVANNLRFRLVLFFETFLA